MKPKTIKIILIVLAVVLFTGAVVHTFTRKVTPPGVPDSPIGESYLYLYPEEEKYIAWRGYDIWIEQDEAALPKPWGVDYYSQTNYYRVYPDGRIVSEFWNKEYGRLTWKRPAQEIYSERTGNYTVYWDQAYHNGWTYDFTEGWCVPGDETEEFLREVLPRTGLNTVEIDDLIADWLPVLEGNAYNLLAFHIDHTQLAIYQGGTGDKVGNTLRVFFLTQPLDEPIDLTPQTFEPFEREGFTVVQWGGVVLS